jgi:hypothetical protein
MVEPTRGRTTSSRGLHRDQRPGQADAGAVTDEIDEAQPRDATADGVPAVIAQLGIEARAEYIRARQRLGLGNEPAERLGSVGRNDDWARAQDLLEAVVANSDDARPSALTDLVSLAIQREDVLERVSRARELESLVRSDASRSLSPERRLDAWQNIASAHASAMDLAAFEAARATFDDVAQEAIANVPAQTDRVREKTALLDLTAAALLAEVESHAAIALATSARDYFVQRLSEEQLPDPEKRRLRALLEDVKALLAELSPSTPSVDLP